MGTLKFKECYNNFLQGIYFFNKSYLLDLESQTCTSLALEFRLPVQ